MPETQRMQGSHDGSGYGFSTLPLPETQWRHHRDEGVRVVVTSVTGRKVVYRRCLADGTRGLETESGVGRFLTIFVPLKE